VAAVVSFVAAEVLPSSLSLARQPASQAFSVVVVLELVVVKSENGRLDAVHSASQMLACVTVLQFLLVCSAALLLISLHSFGRSFVLVQCVPAFFAVGSSLLTVIFQNLSQR